MAPDDVASYARAAAAVAGLQIDEAWWPSVVTHLNALLTRAASLEPAGWDGSPGSPGWDGSPGSPGFVLPDDPAPVFHP